MRHVKITKSDHSLWKHNKLQPKNFPENDDAWNSVSFLLYVQLRR